MSNVRKKVYLYLFAYKSLFLMKKLKILFWNIKTPIKTLFNNSKINDIQLVRG